MAAVIKLPWNSVKIKKAPIFLSVPSLGVEPNDSERDLIIGNIIPPARAVLLGVAGAKIKSTPTSEYASPNVFLPNNLTNWSAIRRPRPVLTNPLEMKKAIAISQILLLPNP